MPRQQAKPQHTYCKNVNWSCNQKKSLDFENVQQKKTGTTFSEEFEETIPSMIEMDIKVLNLVEDLTSSSKRSPPKSLRIAIFGLENGLVRRKWKKINYGCLLSDVVVWHLKSIPKSCFLGAHCHFALSNSCLFCWIFFFLFLVVLVSFCKELVRLLISSWITMRRPQEKKKPLAAAKSVSPPPHQKQP